MNLWRNRHLIVHLYRKVLIDHFGGTYLGIGWALLQPLAMLALYGFVFSVVLRVGPSGEYRDVPFSLWLLCGLVPWIFISDALLRSTNSITSNAQLVTKSMFDKEALPVSTFVGVVISHVITMGFLLMALALFGILPKWGLFGLLAFMLPFGMYVMAWSFLLATLNVYFRDIAQFLPIILQFVFFLTPIVYPLAMAPQWAKSILVLNPHYYIIETYRKTLLIGSFPDLYVIAIMTVGAGLFLILSHRVFSKLSPDFADML